MELSSREETNNEKNKQKQVEIENTKLNNYQTKKQ